MNYLAIDYGTKRIGLAYSINNIIFTLPQLPNNQKFLSQIQKIIIDYQINKIYIGLSEGHVAAKTLEFVLKLKKFVNIPIETVEEAVSTIEAESLYKRLGNKKANFKQNIDSFSAAVILGRALGYN